MNEITITTGRLILRMFLKDEPDNCIGQPAAAPVRADLAMLEMRLET